MLHSKCKPAHNIYICTQCVCTPYSFSAKFSANGRALCGAHIYIHYAFLLCICERVHLLLRQTDALGNRWSLRDSHTNWREGLQLHLRLFNPTEYSLSFERSSCLILICMSGWHRLSCRFLNAPVGDGGGSIVVMQHSTRHDDSEMGWSVQTRTRFN